MTGLINNLVTTGVACGAVALVAFSGAARESFRIQSLKTQWDKTVDEGIPEKFQSLLDEMK